jgi:hypothetical protein
MEVKQKNQNLAFDLTLYLLNKFPSNKEDSLLKTFRSVIKNQDAILPTRI